MPKYRFVVHDGDYLDFTEAIELMNDNVAVRDAHRALAELVEDLPKGACVVFRVAIEDAAGTVIYQASLAFRGETAPEMKVRGSNGDSKL